MLSALLQEEIAVIRELYGLLLREQAALKDRQLATLEQVIQVKEQCVNRLQTLVTERHSQLQQAGFSSQHFTIDAYIEATQPEDPAQLQTLWTELVAITTQTHQQNVINGAIIATSRNYLDHALSILQGHPPRECFYGQGAQKTYAGTQRPLAQV
jgi:flagellar biosynthesis/type III secretory pathway chaperone